MMPLQPSLPLTPPFNNQFLFSDHYLIHLLPHDPRWQDGRANANAFRAFLHDLYAREKKQLPHYNEAQLEQNWIRKILAQLGHVFETQASVPGLEAHIRRPDYVFFVNDAERQAATRAQGTHEYGRHALAVGEVKAWAVPLGKKLRGGGPSFDAQNPSWQIAQYVSALGLNWGILSNGREWRLVQRDSCGRLAIYYQVDLVELLAHDDGDAFLYFTLFFGQTAFRPDAQGRIFLDDALTASAAYARGLEQDLRENVYRALERLMQGFMDLPANRLTQARLREIYDNSLYLLYRLLFILYGESRGLLPLQNDHYRANYSLTGIKQEIAALKYKPAHKTTVYWGRLKNLFQIINGDDAALNRELGVPRYNGGLFSPAMHPFLEQHVVGDRALVEAIDWLSRRDGEFVDYRTLGVRQLGSIYEGLLEYQPRFAEQPMVAVRENKGERWMPQADAPANAKVTDTRDAGALYLETDRGERKATGSYYTPEYIVQYIAQNTLGPLVQDARTRVQSHGDGRRKALSLADAVLNLRVLDPAMGSGHFLVDAMEFLALELANDPYLQEEIPGDEDLLYWKRRVVERCIYGVDKNPLAVELAKLSLWLATVAADQPLSFLDHHLKHGDSLIGARVNDLGSAPPVLLTKKQLAQQQAGQLNLFQHRLQERLPQVMRAILEITEAESDTYERVQLKEVANETLAKLKAPFEQVAHLWTSAYFGNKFTQGDYGEALDDMLTPDRLAALPAIQRAQELANARDFFHWELAFPEVFYDRNGQSLGERAGFDAVIGNPPYANAWMMTEGDEEARSAIEGLVNRSEILEGHWDLYAAFIVRVMELLRENGWHSFIVPDALLREKYATALRRQILTDKSIRHLMHFEGTNVFDEVSRHCIVYVLQDEPSNDATRTSIEAPLSNQSSQTASVGEMRQHEWLLTDGVQIRVDLANPLNKSISDKIFANAIRLGQFCYVMVGATTHSKDGKSFKKADVVTTKKKGNAKQFFDGKTLERYSIVWDGRYLDYRRNEMYGPRVPQLFENEKVVVRDVTGANEQLIVSFDDQNFYCDHLITCVVYYESVDGTGVEMEFEGYTRILPPYPSLQFVTALLASRLMTFVFRLHYATGTLQGNYSHTYPQQVRAFPIRRISFTTSVPERARLVAQITDAYEQGARENETRNVLQLVAHCLQHSPEQSDVVHDVLAQLAQQMIDLNQQKQKVTRAFWDDLEGVTDAAAFQALQKGKQEASLLPTNEVLKPFLRAGSHATRTLDESLAWNADAFKAFVKALTPKIKNLSDLVAMYEKHHARYADTAARLQFTDALIDEIVYVLYGLSAEEIAVIRG